MKLIFLPETALADGKLSDYVSEQLGKLVRQLPRSARAHAVIEAKFFEDAKADSYHRFVCRLKLVIPEGKFETNEASLNIYAAVDIAMAQLKLACRNRGLIKVSRSKRLVGALRRRVTRPQQEDL